MVEDHGYLWSFSRGECLLSQVEEGSHELDCRPLPGLDSYSLSERALLNGTSRLLD